MPVIAQDPQRHAGVRVDDGHCVAYVRAVAHLPHTSFWRRGDPVQGSSLAPGTCIATFSDAGRYENDTQGASHCAVLGAVHDDGSMTVWDQWQGQLVHQRIIRNRNGSGKAANDASRFYVIELEPEPQ
jgi:hypothetical protein